MKKSFLTPDQLHENPELAALQILKTNLDVAEVALLATYPDCEPSCSERCRTEQEAYATSVLYHIDALSAMLNTRQILTTVLSDKPIACNSSWYRSNLSGVRALTRSCPNSGITWTSMMPSYPLRVCLAIIPASHRRLCLDFH